MKQLQVYEGKLRYADYDYEMRKDEIYFEDSEENIIVHLINALYPVVGKKVKITIEVEE